jgi:hypothetical protein
MLRHDFSDAQPYCEEAWRFMVLPRNSRFDFREGAHVLMRLSFDLASERIGDAAQGLARVD